MNVYNKKKYGFFKYTILKLNDTMKNSLIFIMTEKVTSNIKLKYRIHKIVTKY